MYSNVLNSQHKYKYLNCHWGFLVEEGTGLLRWPAVPSEWLASRTFVIRLPTQLSQRSWLPIPLGTVALSELGHCKIGRLQEINAFYYSWSCTHSIHRREREYMILSKSLNLRKSSLIKQSSVSQIETCLQWHMNMRIYMYKWYC